MVGTDKFKDVHKTQMEHIVKGCCSDHPDVNYYYEIQAEDWQQGILRKFKTVRSSSQNENFHLHCANHFNLKTNLLPTTWQNYADPIVCRWNIARGIKAQKYKNYVTRDWMLLEKIRKLFLEKRNCFTRDASILPCFPEFIHVDSSISLFLIFR